MNILKRIFSLLKSLFLKQLTKIHNNFLNVRKLLFKIYDKFWYLEYPLKRKKLDIFDHKKNLINLDTNRIKKCINFNLVDKSKIFHNNNWNLEKNLVEIEKSKEFLLIKDHFINKKNWEESEFYSSFKIYFLKNKNDIDTYDDNDFKLYLDKLDQIFNNIKKSDFKDIKNKIKVGIGKNGAFIIIRGMCYFSIIKVLEVKTIPVEIIFRHQKWKDFRNDLLKFLVIHKIIYQPLIHPDLDFIKTSYDDQRFNIIKNQLNQTSGTLLDIGANFGYFCHKFEDIGFNCVAVEIRPRNVYFMKKLKNIEKKSFTIINKSIFNLEHNIEYDVVLALNIFHHFLREKDLYLNLITFLKNLKVKELFFQPHNPNESIMRNAYVNYNNKQFVNFIIKNSCLKKFKLCINTIEGIKRPIYKLF